LQFVEIGNRNPAFAKTVNEMFHEVGRRRFLTFGIPILSVEHDLLKLLGQAAKFVFVLSLLDALQAKVKSFFRCIHGGGSMAAALFGFRPS